MSKIDAWRQLREEILQNLDIRRAYEEYGVKFTGKISASNWAECHAVGREDKSPSAAVNLTTGVYKDFAGDRASIFDFMVANNISPSWQEAQEELAKKCGLANTIPKKAKAKRTQDVLGFTNTFNLVSVVPLARQYGIEPQTIAMTGARIARYPANAQEPQIVCAFPVYSPISMLETPPDSYVLQSGSGKPIMVYQGPDTPQKPEKRIVVGTTGILNRFALENWAGAERIYKVEGLSDMLVLQNFIPDEYRTKHLVITNACGCQDIGPAINLVKKCDGKEIILIHDADVPGQSGAFAWCKAVSPAAKTLKNVQLPYSIEKSKGKDLRDWIREPGRAYADLLSIVDSTSDWKKDSGSLSSAPTSLKLIKLENNELVVNEQVIDRLREEPDIYNYMGQLATIELDNGKLKICPFTRPRLRERISSICLFHEGEGTPRVPDWCSKAILDRPTWPGFKRLEGVSTTPFLNQDGRVCQSNGYDSRSGIYLHLSGEFPVIDEFPLDEQVHAAVDELLGIVADFPFKLQCHRSAYLAALLTPFARNAYEGPTGPFFLIAANTPGTGKGLLASVISIIVNGTRPSNTAAPASSNNDEWRKLITSFMLGGQRLVVIDNIEGDIGCPALDMALTSTEWSDRILKESRIASGRLDFTWLGTGNNPVLSSDMARRTYEIRLETDLENPEDRRDFRIPFLETYVLQHRPKLIAAALTILRSYVAAGTPLRGLAAPGGFSGWSSIVREAIVFTQMDDPDHCRKLLRESSDSTKEALDFMIDALRATSRGCGLSSLEMLKIAKNDLLGYNKCDAEKLEAAILKLCDQTRIDNVSQQSLGSRLGQRRDRVIGGWRLHREKRARAWYWSAVTADQAANSQTASNADLQSGIAEVILRDTALLTDRRTH